MKKNYILYLVLITAIFFAGCKKDDGPIPKAIGVERVPAPLLVKDASANQTIDILNLANFTGKVNVSMYFPNDVRPQKFDIVVRKNNSNANVKVLEANVTTFPTSVTVTAAKLQALFGAPVVLGDNYDIGADVYTQNGKKYEAFPLIGAGYATAFQADHPGFSPTVRYSAICAYSAALYPTGNYVVVVDQWGDYAAGETIAVTQIDATHLSFMYKPETGSQPIIVTINPVTNATSVTKQAYGNYPSFNPYGTMSVNTSPSNDNVVSPCDQSFGVFLDHTVQIGGATASYGKYLIKIKRP